MIVNVINDFLTNNKEELNKQLLDEVAVAIKRNFERQFGKEQERSNALRLSGIGQCLRKQAYNLHGFEQNGKKIDSRGKMVFFQGDMAELAIVYLAKAAGLNVQHVGVDQIDVEIDGVVGHPDGLLVTSTDKYLIEAKSMSSYGFESFERGDIDESYIYQVNAYMHALGVNKCIFIAMNKDSGVLGEALVHLDVNIVDTIKSSIALLKESSKDLLPPRKYVANDKKIYPWQCLYCAFHGTCLPNATKVLVGKSYKLKEQ